MFGITNPFTIKIAEYLIVIAVVFGAAWYVYSKGWDACDAEHLVKQSKANEELQAKYDKVSSDYEDLKKKRVENANTITREITKVIEQPIYSNVCISDDGRMLINAALSGSSPSTGKPDATVQTAPNP